MTATIPSGDPPPHLLAKALSYLAMEVGKAAPLGPSSLVPILSRYLSLLARHRTSAPLGPLHAFSSLCAEAPEYVTVPLACDAVLAYPAEVGVLDSALSNVKVDFDALVRRLPSRLSRQGVRLAHGLLRLRTTENVVVKHSQDLVRAMVRAYPQASAGEKGEMLVLARALVGKDAELRKLLTNEGPKGVPLLSQSMGRDYADLFEARLPLPEAQAVSVRDAHDAERSTDPRLPELAAMFPHIPQHLLGDALAHPHYTAAAGSTEDALAPLVEALFSNSLPADLRELKAAAASDGPSSEPAPAPARTATQAPAAAPARRTQFTDDDLKRMRLKDTETVPDLDLGREIPDNLRASILRLVEAQEVEAEEARKAIAEAHGLDPDEDEDVQRVVRARDGDESEGENDSVDLASERSTSPPPPGLERPSKTQSQIQTRLELAYLRTPDVFARDAATRRSKARNELREATGMDDGQIEGWKVMLERNPHKDAILERHNWSRGEITDDSGKDKGKAKKAGGGGGQQQGSGSGGQGSGGGQGGRGGQGGGGRGRGGGRPNKGSRGHSNAARVRGRDKKMSKMGAGL